MYSYPLNCKWEKKDTMGMEWCNRNISAGKLSPIVFPSRESPPYQGQWWTAPSQPCAIQIPCLVQKFPYHSKHQTKDHEVCLHPNPRSAQISTKKCTTKDWGVTWSMGARIQIQIADTLACPPTSLRPRLLRIASSLLQTKEMGHQQSQE